MGCNDSDKNVGHQQSTQRDHHLHSSGAELPEYVDTTFVGTAGDADNSPDDFGKWTTDDNQELCPPTRQMLMVPPHVLQPHTRHDKNHHDRHGSI